MPVFPRCHPLGPGCQLLQGPADSPGQPEGQEQSGQARDAGAGPDDAVELPELSLDSVEGEGDADVGHAAVGAGLHRHVHHGGVDGRRCGGWRCQSAPVRGAAAHFRPVGVIVHLLRGFFGIGDHPTVHCQERDAGVDLLAQNAHPFLERRLGHPFADRFPDQHRLGAQAVFDLVQEKPLGAADDHRPQQSDGRHEQHAEGDEQAPKHARTPHVPTPFPPRPRTANLLQPHTPSSSRLNSCTVKIIIANRKPEGLFHEHIDRQRHPLGLPELPGPISSLCSWKAISTA